MPCELSDQQALESLIARVREEFAGLRAIIHCAGEWFPDQASGMNPSAVFTRCFDLHARVPYLLNTALADMLGGKGRAMGDIIHVTDFVVQRGSKKHIAYAASKAALDNMTLSFAAALAPHAKVNAIAPALLTFRDTDDQEYRSKAGDRSLLPPGPGEEEALRAVDLLMESQYMTGRTLYLDGGRPLVYE